jgi:hypothetical protein
MYAYLALMEPRYPAPIAFCGISPLCNQASKRRSEPKPGIIGSEIRAE